MTRNDSHALRVLIVMATARFAKVLHDRLGAPRKSPSPTQQTYGGVAASLASVAVVSGLSAATIVLALAIAQVA
jgi:hypothetical protein